MKIIKDIYYDGVNAMDIYVPENIKCEKTLVFFHGGGIEEGDKCGEYIDDLSKIFTDKGVAFVSVNYSLYPNTKFPLFIKDCAKSIKFLFENTNFYGISRNFYISGSSAGAYITAMLCVDSSYLESEGIDPLSIRGWISDDGQMTDHFNIQKHECNMDPWEQRITKLAPLFYINKNTHFSRMLLIYYDNDLPMRKEQNLLFYSTVKHFNNDADIIVKELSGTHCEGTVRKDSYGHYRFADLLLEWMK